MTETPSNNNESFIVSGNVLISYSGTNNNIVIPDNIVEIANNAFMNNQYIQTIKFSDNTKIIGESAFENCINLCELNNYDKVQYYKKYCFKNTGLIELEFNENTMDIGEEAFFGNNNLTKIIYKPNKNIKLKRSFAKCQKLQEVEIDKKYFYPSFGPYLRGDGRPTFHDAFWNTPYSAKMKDEYITSYKKGICPDCGGVIKKGIFNAKCKDCGIYYKRT